VQLFKQLAVATVGKTNANPNAAVIGRMFLRNSRRFMLLILLVFFSSLPSKPTTPL
jgi:hypothetical protein